MKKLMISALAAPILFSSSGANAAPHAPFVAINYADLDIRHDEGALELLTRIHGAARKVCGAEPNIGDLHEFGRWDECVRKAERDAVAAVKSPRVSRLAGFEAPPVRTAGN